MSIKVEGFCLFFLLLLIVSCSNGDNPVAPDSTTSAVHSRPQPRITDPNSQSFGENPSRHIPWGMRVVRVDPSTCEYEEATVRHAVDHLNVIRFLEVNPCQTCLAVTAIQPGTPGTLLVDLTITHPYLNPLFTAFDVRAIFMFNGSHVFPESGFVVADRFLGDAGLANADGYTTLYNPQTAGHGLEGWLKGRFATDEFPNCRLNPFIRLFTDDPLNTRNAFLAGESVTVTCTFDKPDGPFVFGYAVDACWAPPLNHPVEDPMIDFGPDANCAEAWKIKVSETPIGDGLNDFGGETLLTMDVYDWQGPDTENPPRIECPELFTGALEAEWVGDFDGFSRYEATIANLKLAQSGYYACLIGKEASENDPSKPWLDLTSYEIHYLRVNHPFNPVDITPEGLNINAVDAVVDGNYAYISSDNLGLKIYDITDPSAPVLVKTVEYDDTFRDIAYKDGYVYACLVHDLLAVIDVDPPETAGIVRTVELIDRPEGICAGAGYVYLITNSYTDYLEIIDISNPEEAYRVSAVAVKTDPWVVASDGSTVYTVSRGYLEIWDASNPHDVTQIESLKIPNTYEEPRQIALSNGYAYVASTDAGVLIIDVSPPDEPELVYQIDVDNIAGVAVVDDMLFFTDYYYLTGTLQVADITNPAAPEILHSFPEYGGLIEIHEGKAYFAARDLKIADITQPDAVTALGFIGTTFYMDHMALHNGYCFVTAELSGMKVVDIDPVESSSIISMAIIAGRPSSIDIEGDLAYIGMGHDGYAVVDISDVESPEVTATVDIGPSVFDMDVEGSYAYVGTTMEFKVFDITDPVSPEEIVSLDTASWACSLKYRDGLVYIATRNATFLIFDVSDPYSAFQLTQVNLPGEAHYFATDDDYAVVTCEDSLAFIDINPPGDAHLVTSYEQEKIGYMGVAISDGYAFVPDSPALIFDVRPPWIGQLVHAFCSPGSRNDIAIDGNILYISDNDGLFITQLW